MSADRWDRTWPSQIPREQLDALPTPCLVVDVAAADRNIATASDHFMHGSLKLRPHFKAHKCLGLLDRQLRSTATVGATCATASEALVLARHGVRDILIANEVVDRADRVKLVAALREARVTVAVDSFRHVELLTETVPEPLVLDVVIELDTGYHRCGIAEDDQLLLDLARAVAASPRLRLAGLLGYEGHAVLDPDRDTRARIVGEAAGVFANAIAVLSGQGFRCDVVSGGGTGTFDLWPPAGPLTEVEAGSYVLMDSTYRQLDLPFVPALYCLATVISRSGDRAVANAGLKAMSREYGLPELLSEGTVTGLADEHVLMTTRDDLEIGSRVWLIPSHVDPTVNLHSTLFAWERTTGFAEWPVARDR